MECGTHTTSAQHAVFHFLAGRTVIATVSLLVQWFLKFVPSMTQCFGTGRASIVSMAHIASWLLPQPCSAPGAIVHGTQPSSPLLLTRSRPCNKRVATAQGSIPPRHNPCWPTFLDFNSRTFPCPGSPWRLVNTNNHT